MSSSPPLLDDSPPTATQAPSVSLSIRSGGAQGPAQKQFNQLLIKIEAAKAALIELQDIEANFLPERVRRLAPLFSQLSTLQARLVVFLDQRLLDPKSLSWKVQEDIATVILRLAEKVRDTDSFNPTVEEIYKRRSPGLNEPDASEILTTERHEMSSGISETAFGEPKTSDSPDAWFEAAEAKASAQRQAAEEARAARQAQRRSNALKQRHAEASLAGDKVVREIYRKLASALHPDRESDATERERKSALMMQVNTANDRRDLLALLELQLRIEQLSPKDVASMADEKLQRLIGVLKGQDKSLNETKLQMEAQIREKLNLAWNTPISLRGVDTALRQQAQYLQSGISIMQRDLAAIQHDAELKRWVKQQIGIMDAHPEAR